ncbi:MAG: hypothetical protein J5809_07990 [Selenomonadaceae bacterium]|nr:hypothetical protein [Selenomonadaceae bacterium]
MTETMSFTVDSEDVKTFEEKTGLKFVDGIKLLMDNLKYGGEFGLDPFWSEENQSLLRKIYEDVKHGRNMHEHELIEVDE